MSLDVPCPHPGAGPDGAPGDADQRVTGSAARRFALPVSADGLTYSAYGRICDAAGSSPCWYHFPSLNVNAGGDLLVGFSGSRATEYIGAFYQGRRANGTWMSRPGLIQVGRGPFGSDRWGDYSATTIDPNDGSFWTVQEYADPIAIALWGTWITQVGVNP